MLNLALFRENQNNPNFESFLFATFSQSKHLSVTFQSEGALPISLQEIHEFKKEIKTKVYSCLTVEITLPYNAARNSKLAF